MQDVNIYKETSKIINERGGLESDLACGRDEQTEAVYRNIDSDAHACKSQVTLPHNGLQSFVHGLKERSTIHFKMESHISIAICLIYLSNMSNNNVCVSFCSLWPD